MLSKIKDINILCEALRDLSFKEKYGAYSCFELEIGFYEIHSWEDYKGFKKNYFLLLIQT